MIVDIGFQYAVTEVLKVVLNMPIEGYVRNGVFRVRASTMNQVQTLALLRL